MKASLQRRKFLTGSLFGFFALVTGRAAFAAAPAITEKDILKEGQPAAIANYCENAAKKPNKFCPQAVPANTCAACQFYTANTETTFKGTKYAKCQIVPTSPNFVASTGTCATFVKKAGA